MANFIKNQFMKDNSAFKEQIEKGYSCKGEFITLGAAMLGEETLTNSLVKIPLKTVNKSNRFSLM